MNLQSGTEVVNEKINNGGSMINEHEWKELSGRICDLFKKSKEKKPELAAITDILQGHEPEIIALALEDLDTEQIQYTFGAIPKEEAKKVLGKIDQKE